MLNLLLELVVILLIGPFEFLNLGLELGSVCIDLAEDFFIVPYDNFRHGLDSALPFVNIFIVIFS